jgi:hypothetical protein
MVMFKVQLSFVPPGGGEVDYGLTIMVPAVPREGDYITVMREGKTSQSDEHVGTENFIVRRVWWNVKYPDDGQMTHEVGKEPVGTAEIGVECEFALSAYSSQAHRQGAHSKAKHPPKEFEATNY